MSRPEMIDAEPQVYRSDNEEPPGGTNVLRWVVSGQCWEVTAPSTLEPGDVYIPAPWLEDL